jgi:hypothetical protein
VSINFILKTFSGIFYLISEIMAIDKSKRIGKWYFGGFASAGAACCTHPLDLLKVHLQTAGASTTGPKPNLIRYFDFGF